MLLHSRDLLRLPVVTKNGQSIGRVSGFEFEAESQIILRYEVRRSMLRGKPLLIHRQQVISIEATRMVVEDGALTDVARESITFRPAVQSEQPTVVTLKND